MKGHNVLRFNQATMKEAVQMYLDHLMKEGKAPIVDIVIASRDHDSNGHFEIKVKEELKEESAS